MPITKSRHPKYNANHMMPNPYGRGGSTLQPHIVRARIQQGEKLLALSPDEQRKQAEEMGLDVFQRQDYIAIASFFGSASPYDPFLIDRAGWKPLQMLTTRAISSLLRHQIISLVLHYVWHWHHGKETCPHSIPPSVAAIKEALLPQKQKEIAHLYAELQAELASHPSIAQQATTPSHSSLEVHEQSSQITTSPTPSVNIATKTLPHEGSNGAVLPPDVEEMLQAIAFRLRSVKQPAPSTDIDLRLERALAHIEDTVQITIDRVLREVFERRVVSLTQSFETAIQAQIAAIIKTMQATYEQDLAQLQLTEQKADTLALELQDAQKQLAQTQHSVAAREKTIQDMRELARLLVEEDSTP